MKNYLKDKRVLVGLVIVAGAVGYYIYDQKRKAKIKADAEILANTAPTPTPIIKSPKHDANYKSLDMIATNNAPTPVTID
jgi:uncharacterized membrane protein YebE (DUF533 family)